MRTNLITLDNTNAVALGASLAALDESTRTQIRHALHALTEVDDTDALLCLIRETLAETDTTGRTPVGVLFADHDYYDDAIYLGDPGIVVYTDGSTDRVTFTNAHDLLADLVGTVSATFQVTVDLRTGVIDGTNDADPCRAFGMTKPVDQVNAETVEVQAR